MQNLSLKYLFVYDFHFNLMSLNMAPLCKELNSVWMKPSGSGGSMLVYVAIIFTCSIEFMFSVVEPNIHN